MTEQWSDRSAMLNHKTLPPSGPLSYLRGSELKTWTSYWKKEGSAGMDMWNAPSVQSRQPLTYRLMESVGLGGPRWLGSSWQRGIAESGSSLTAIDPHDRDTWRSGVRSAMRAASQLPGRGPTVVDMAPIPARSSKIWWWWWWRPSFWPYMTKFWTWPRYYDDWHSDTVSWTYDQNCSL